VCKKRDLCVQIRFFCRLHRDALVEAQECYVSHSLVIQDFLHSAVSWSGTVVWCKLAWKRPLLCSCASLAEAQFNLRTWQHCYFNCTKPKSGEFSFWFYLLLMHCCSSQKVSVAYGIMQRQLENKITMCTNCCFS
jgi:hypothetical protein